MCELTVIIPTWNQKELLARCLRSLRGQTVPCRVLVVDNGSSDSTLGLLEELRLDFSGRLEWIGLPANRGFAAAVNQGIRGSRTEFIGLLNNDAEADSRWVETGLNALRDRRDYSFFASRLVQYHNREILDGAGDGYNRTGIPFKRGWGERAESFRISGPVLGASGAAAFYRRRLFDEVGLFDETFFMYLEDVDLSLRAQLLGHRCLYLPEAVVHHIEAASDPLRRQSAAAENAVTLALFSSPDRVYWITRNRWQLMVTYQPARHFPWLLYGWARSAGHGLLKAGYFSSFLSGLLAGVLLTPRALKKRLALRRKRKVPLMEIYRLRS